MREKECWEGEEEGDEYEDCVDDAGYNNSVSDILSFNIPCSLQMFDLFISSTSLEIQQLERRAFDK